MLIKRLLKSFGIRVPAVKTKFNRIVIVTDSSQIGEVSYDTNTKTMQVAFVNGAIYQYLKVYEFDFAKLVAAASVGKAFNSIIKDKFECVKIR